MQSVRYSLDHEELILKCYSFTTTKKRLITDYKST